MSKRTVVKFSLETGELQLKEVEEQYAFELIRAFNKSQNYDPEGEIPISELLQITAAILNKILTGVIVTITKETEEIYSLNLIKLKL